MWEPGGVEWPFSSKAQVPVEVVEQLRDILILVLLKDGNKGIWSVPSIELQFERVNLLHRR